MTEGDPPWGCILWKVKIHRSSQQRLVFVKMSVSAGGLEAGKPFKREILGSRNRDLVGAASQVRQEA